MMSEKRSVWIDGEKVQVDPQLLFQHLVTAAGDEPDNIVDHFKYELCSHPSAMFEPNGSMREADKPGVADAIFKTT